MCNVTFAKLRGKMAESGVSQEILAKELGISPQSMCSKINGKTQFTLEELIKISSFLKINDPSDIFFK